MKGRYERCHDILFTFSIWIARRRCWRHFLKVLQFLFSHVTEQLSYQEKGFQANKEDSSIRTSLLLPKYGIRTQEVLKKLL